MMKDCEINIGGIGLEEEECKGMVLLKKTKVTSRSV